MRRVISISLNGNAWQLEEAGYEALRAYLEVAGQRLADNPDRQEILSDLEQAIADKFGQYLSPHKSVVTVEEVERVLHEMGPVDGAAGAASGTAGTGAAVGDAAAANDATLAPTKRLYQIQEGAMISGVCNGLAAYLNLDVTVVRVIFVVLTLLTGGLWILAYLVMMFVIPYARTSEQHAQAHGWPFNAEELIGRAKAHYAEFKNSGEWRRHWREQRRMWKDQRRYMRAQWRHWHKWGYAYGAPPPWNPAGAGVAASPGSQALGGALMPVIAIFSVLLSLALVFGLVSLVTHHGLFGWALPTGMPLWLGVVLLIVVYQVVKSPLRAARHAAYYGGPVSHGWLALWGVVLWLAFVTALTWVCWHNWPEVQHFLQEFVGWVNDLVTDQHVSLSIKA